MSNIFIWHSHHNCYISLFNLLQHGSKKIFYSNFWLFQDCQQSFFFGSEKSGRGRGGGTKSMPNVRVATKKPLPRATQRIRGTTRRSYWPRPTLTAFITSDLVASLAPPYPQPQPTTTAPLSSFLPLLLLPRPDFPFPTALLRFQPRRSPVLFTRCDVVLVACISPWVCLPSPLCFLACKVASFAASLLGLSRRACFLCILRAFFVRSKVLACSSLQHACRCLPGK
jgi:hypothetical protein